MAQTENGQPQMKLQDKIEQTLIEARRIFISQAIDSESAEDAIKKLWYLDLAAPGKPILMVIHSPGGSIDSGFAIWDQIKMISSPVITLVSGLAASMGSVLSLAAQKGRRFATANARIMIHQPSLSGMFKGQATDLDIQAREILKTRENLVRLYAECTGKDAAAINKALDRDNWMSAQEALEFGLIDQIITSFKELESLGL